MNVLWIQTSVKTVSARTCAGATVASVTPATSLTLAERIAWVSCVTFLKITQDVASTSVLFYVQNTF